MRQLSSLDAQFLDLESATTVGHVGAMVLLDPSTAPGGALTLDGLRAVLEPRLHLAPLLRQRLVEIPLGLGRPYWADDPDFDLEFHLRELALPGNGDEQELGEQVARIHARPLDRRRPLWEMYLVHNVSHGRSAVYSKVHHAAIDGVSGAEIVTTIMDFTIEPGDVEAPDRPWSPEPVPSWVDLLGRGVDGAVRHPAALAKTVPRALPHLAELPGAANIPGAQALSDLAVSVTKAFGGDDPRGDVERRPLRTPRTPLNVPITAHRRFAFGAVPLDDVKRVKTAFAMTVNDVVMTLCTSALRRWLLDHDGLPDIPIVIAVPVSIRTDGEQGANGNQLSVMLAEMPTHLADPRDRLLFVRDSMNQAKRQFEAVPASILQDLSAVLPTALNGLAGRALFRLLTVPGPPFNLFVSNVPGPQLPLYIGGARVLGVHPVSAVSDLTGALNITLFSYDGDLDFGLIACREVLPDAWNLIDYLRDALDELVALPEVSGPAAPPAAPLAPI